MDIKVSYVILSGCLGWKDTVMSQLRSEGLEVVAIPKKDAIVIYNTTKDTVKRVLEAIGFGGGTYTELY